MSLESCVWILCPRIAIPHRWTYFFSQSINIIMTRNVKILTVPTDITLGHFFGTKATINTFMKIFLDSTAYYKMLKYHNYITEIVGCRFYYLTFLWGLYFIVYLLKKKPVLYINFTIETNNNIKSKNKIRGDIYYFPGQEGFCYVICIIRGVGTGAGLLARLNVFSGSTPSNEC